MPSTLPEWLAYIERQHPKSIDMGLARVREVARRMRLRKPASDDESVYVSERHGV